MSNISRRSWGAIATLAGVGVHVVIIVALHLLQPGYDPMHQLMSELALGPHGWAMYVASLSLATAVFGVQASIARHGAGLPYRGLLLAATLFILLAGAFPLGNAPALHVGAITIAFVLLVLAMYLFPSNAGRASSVAPRPLSWTLAAGVAVSVALGQTTLPIGISQRLAASCLLGWLAILAWRLPRR